MKESDLYIPVRDWLAAQGYEIHVEMFDADIVAVRDGRLTVVELKRAWTGDFIMQLQSRKLWADFIYAVIPGKRRCEKRYAERRRQMASVLRHNGFGCLLVDDGAASHWVSPKPQPWHWHQAREYRLRKLTGRVPAMQHETAGLPNSPALRKQREDRER